MATSPSRPRKMHGAPAPASESATPGRNRPSSIGGSDFSGPSRNGSRRHIGNISEDGSRRLDLIQFVSVRFSLARLRGLPANGIIFLWWTHLDSNQGPLACEASALTGLSYASTGAWDYRAARATSQERGTSAIVVSSKRASHASGAHHGTTTTSE